MFEQLRQRLREAPRPAGPDDEQLAAAVLLLEVARADYEHHGVEREALGGTLAREFGLAPAALEALLAQAERRADESVSLHDFVTVLNRRLAPERKRALVKWLWDVAHADGRVDAHEEHLIRRLADLLHLSHQDFIRAKLDRDG